MLFGTSKFLNKLSLKTEICYKHILINSMASSWEYLSFFQSVQKGSCSAQYQAVLKSVVYGKASAVLNFRKSYGENYGGS